MNILGIQLTPGHLIIGAILMILYDAIWTWLFTNKASSWWFERLQGFLKTGIYLAFLALVVLIIYTPWPWNLVLVLSTAASSGLLFAWLQKK